MRATVNEFGERILAIGNEEWFEKERFNERAETFIASKLADTFTDEELRELVFIDMKKVQKLVVGKIAEKVVDKCLHDERFFERKEKKNEQAELD